MNVACHGFKLTNRVCISWWYEVCSVPFMPCRYTQSLLRIIRSCNNFWIWHISGAEFLLSFMQIHGCLVTVAGTLVAKWSFPTLFALNLKLKAINIQVCEKIKASAFKNVCLDLPCSDVLSSWTWLKFQNLKFNKRNFTYDCNASLP